MKDLSILLISLIFVDVIVAVFFTLQGLFNMCRFIMYESKGTTSSMDSNVFYLPSIFWGVFAGLLLLLKYLP
jgi:hypothetical protein